MRHVFSPFAYRWCKLRHADRFSTLRIYSTSDHCVVLFRDDRREEASPRSKTKPQTRLTTLCATYENLPSIPFSCLMFSSYDSTHAVTAFTLWACRKHRNGSEKRSEVSTITSRMWTVEVVVAEAGAVVDPTFTRPNLRQVKVRSTVPKPCTLLRFIADATGAEKT